MRRWRTAAVLGGLAASAFALWRLSGGTWGSDEQYAISSSEYRSVGQDKPVDAPRLGLVPLEGARTRLPLEVPMEVFQDVRDGDGLRIRTRLLPVLSGELIQYTLLRRGDPVRQWDEGWPFFAITLGIGTVLGAGVVYALIAWLVAVFRLSPPPDV